MICSTQIGRVPIDETLEIDERNPVRSLTGERAGIAGRPGTTVVRGLPVVVHLRVNPTVTGRVTGGGARITVVRNKSGIENVERKVVLSPSTVRPASVGSVIAVRRVLEGCACPLDTVNLDEEATGRTRGMPA